MAERKGFEPLIPFGIRAFQARALGQTTLPLHLVLSDASAILPLSSLIGKDKEKSTNRKQNHEMILVFSVISIAISLQVNYNIATRAVSSVG